MNTSFHNSDELTLRARQALECLNTTQAPVFLTGNAGTGKTTFLKNLWQHTHKKYIVVAPTGIAALNAGGTTIHSQFLLPFGTFLPGRDTQIDTFSATATYNQQMLARKHPLNTQRKKIFRSINLLVIDEVSMLRADLLDAIDYRLRAARSNYHQPFGGVQVLFIGDLHQLPPVVKREDDIQLKNHYASPWFFEAHCLRNTSMIYIELDKIFRQQDDRFIRILNNLRHNRASEADYSILNQQFRENLDISQVKDTITLTTHNNQADTINLLALEDLPGNARQFNAIISGDFPPSMFPVPELLSLKKGCQVMFVKNDSEGKSYYNGRLATVTDFTETGIEVRMHDDQTSLAVGRQKWENKKYEVNPENQEITDSVTGTFEQLPVKLAWAITIHKSQGLTFDKAIIDPGRAFADGQVYVALSRLRTLEGLILKTRIHSGIVSTDPMVVHFSNDRNQPDQFEAELSKRQADYLGGCMVSAFDFSSLIRLCRASESTDAEETIETNGPFHELKMALIGQQTNADRFREQLLSLLGTSDQSALQDRLHKGVTYFTELLQKQLTDILKISHAAQSKKNSKGLRSAADELDHHLMSKLSEIGRLPKIISGILDRKNWSPEIFVDLDEKQNAWRLDQLKKIEHETPADLSEVKPKKRKARKQPDGEQASHLSTVKLLRAGLNTRQISAERGLAMSTIEEHLARGIAESLINISDWITPAQQQQIAYAASNLSKPFKLKDLVEATGNKFSYGEVRAVLVAHRIEYERTVRT